MSWQRRRTKYNKEVTNDYERTDVEVFLFIHLMHHKKATTWVWHTIIQIIQIILGMTYNNKKLLSTRVVFDVFGRPYLLRVNTWQGWTVFWTSDWALMNDTFFIFSPFLYFWSCSFFKVDFYISFVSSTLHFVWGAVISLSGANVFCFVSKPWHRSSSGESEMDYSCISMFFVF